MTDSFALLRGFAALVVVLGVLGLLAWLARRGTLALPGRGRGTAAVRIETAVSLGERRSLVIVAVEGRRLLLGLTPVQVSFVTELAGSPPGLVRSCATIAGEMSTPSTRMPRAARGSAIRPVPMASSKAGPGPARCARNATVAHSSPRWTSRYIWATSAPKLMTGL